MSFGGRDQRMKMEGRKEGRLITNWSTFSEQSKEKDLGEEALCDINTLTTRTHFWPEAFGWPFPPPPTWRNRRVLSLAHSSFCRTAFDVPCFSRFCLATCFPMVHQEVLDIKGSWGVLGASPSQGTPPKLSMSRAPLVSHDGMRLA